MPDDRLIWTPEHRLRVIEVRDAHGHTQERLAEILEGEFGAALSQSGLSKILDGNTGRPSEPVLRALLEYLEDYGRDVPKSNRLDEAGGVRFGRSDTEPLSAELRLELRSLLVRELLPTAFKNSSRESVKLLRQAADWAGLPASALADDIGDLLTD